MTVRFSQLLRGRVRGARGISCCACGEEILADGHAIQLSAGVYHAGCVLYRPRAAPELAPPSETRLRATR
ncbi:MAG TPA: hypothetical protein VGC98_00435 [Thermoleophilaceae bacterium]|jgi:hypothetical protein